MKSSSSFVVRTLAACSLGLLCTLPAFAQQSPGDASSGGAPSLDQLVTPPGTSSQQDPNKLAQDMAFQSALDGAMPLNPDQVQQLIARMSEMQRVTAPSIMDPVRPRSELKVETISLDPGVQPPVIKVAAGYVTTVMMMDASGAPWDIVDMAFAGRFDIKTSQQNPHIIRITPLNRFYEGNLTMQLKDLASPITFRLVAGNDEVYFRYDVRVPAMGPKARPPRFASANSMVAGDSVMMAVLDGYPPSSARRLKVTGLDDRSAAWDVNGQIYLRTPHSLLSPAWSSSTASGDGTTVYAIPDTPVLLLSDQGIMVRARVTRPEGFVSGDAQ
jgi:intracellular multiplication protein IcmK